MPGGGVQTQEKIGLLSLPYVHANLPHSHYVREYSKGRTVLIESVYPHYIGNA